MTAFLFPGQGSQIPGMGADFYEASAAVRERLDQAAAALPEGFLDTLFHGDSAAVNDTRFAQPALLAVEVAIADHLAAAGRTPSVCAGHSLGEIPALVVADVCRFDDALIFTQERARLMSEDVPAGGMAAVMGLAPEDIAPALPEGVQVANYNAPGQTIISGARDPLAAAAEALKAAGAKRVLPLKVSGPFHSEYMRPAADEFTRVLADVPFLAPRVPFVSSVSGEAEDDPDRIRRLLGEQLVSPVRWTDVMVAIGEGEAIEAGPGKVLAGLAKRTPGSPSVAPAGTVEAADGLSAS